MFSDLFSKVGTLADHHQFIFAIMVTICIVIASWSIEQILEHYIFPKKKLVGYITAIITAVILLWVIKHFVLHVI